MLAINIPADGLFLAIQNKCGKDLSFENWEKIINEYIGGRLNVYHFDMYRIETFDDLYSTNFFEYCEMGGVVVCEWSENIENVLPENHVKISISHGENENTRVFEIEGLDI